MCRRFVAVTPPPSQGRRRSPSLTWSTGSSPPMRPTRSRSRSCARSSVGFGQVRREADPHAAPRRAWSLAEDNREPSSHLPGGQAGSCAGRTLGMDRAFTRPSYRQPKAEGARDPALRVVGGDRGDLRGASPPIRGCPALRGRHGSTSRGMDRTRTPRHRPQRGRSSRSARLHSGTLEGVREDEPPTTARAASPARPGRSRRAPPASGLAPAFPGC